MKKFIISQKYKVGLILEKPINIIHHINRKRDKADCIISTDAERVLDLIREMQK